MLKLLAPLQFPFPPPHIHSLLHFYTFNNYCYLCDYVLKLDLAIYQTVNITENALIQLLGVQLV